MNLLALKSGRRSLDREYAAAQIEGCQPRPRSSNAATQARIRAEYALLTMSINDKEESTLRRLVAVIGEAVTA